MLRIDELSKTYRSAAAPALDRISFSVAEGAFLALLGPNGAGKSTLLHILAGRTDADSGAVFLRGERLSSSPARLRSLIGIVPQEIRLDFVFTVEEILRLEMGFYGLRPDETRIRALLERLSLSDKRRERARSLSGGMLRRLMIARALVHKPRLLLLDEPTAGVDLRLRHDLYALLRELRAAGTTIMLTTHYLEEAEQLCERVVMLDQGRVVADATREAFLRMAGDFLTVDIRTSAGDKIREIFAADGAVSVAHTVDGLRFLLPASARGELLRKLSLAEPEMRSLEILKPKLEEVFLKLTRQGGHPHAHLS
jgi:ABC-2 type transport system ATP-binding protein